MKKLIAILAVVALIAAGAYWYVSKKADTGKKKYETALVTRGDITSTVSATGRLKAKTSVLVGTEVSGTIRKILVDYNSVVKKGQELIMLDQELFQAQVEQARANLSAAEARLNEIKEGKGMQHSGVVTTLARTKATLDKSAADLKRQKELYARGMVAMQDLDATEEAYQVAKSQYEQSTSETAKDAVTDAQIASARASVRQARAVLDTAETNFRKTVIRAPMDGVVINRNVEVGQTVAASFSTPTLLDIEDLSKMQVEISIDEADVGASAVGQEADFTVDAFPGRVFKGRLACIYYNPVTVQNVVTYSGIIEVENPERILRPGMTANVKIITSTKSGVLLVPNAALRVKMDGGPDKMPKSIQQGNAKTVWTLGADNKTAPARVTIGVTDFVNTEITSGLKEGDAVLTEAPAGKTKAGGGMPGGMPGGMRMGH